MQDDRASEFIKLWSAESRRVYAYLVALVTNRADADELFQDTSCVLWQKFSEFEPGTSFRAWAFRIARNKVMSFRQLRRHSLEQSIGGDEFAQVVENLLSTRATELDVQFGALANCLAKLRQRDRRLIELRYDRNASVTAIAQEIGRSVDATYKALRRVQRSLLACVMAASA